MEFVSSYVSVIRGPFEKFMGSPYYSESELCGGAVTVSFSKYLSWQAMHFLQRSTKEISSCSAILKRVLLKRPQLKL
jgi:hypothetical protein